MNFTKEQVRRSNWTFAMVLLIICAVTFLFNLAVVVSGKGLVKMSAFCMILLTFWAAATIIAYRLLRYSDKLKIVLTIIWLVDDAVGFATTDCSLTYPIAILGSIAIIVFLDRMLAVIYGIVSLLTVIIVGFAQVKMGLIKDGSYVMFAAVMVLIAGISVVCIINLLGKYYAEAQTTIEQQLEKQGTVLEKQNRISEEVLGIFGQLTQKLEVINEKSDQNRSSMHGVGENMNNTALGIQSQAEASEKIQKKIEDTEKEANYVKGIADEVIDSVSKGISISEEFGMQSKNVNETTNQMRDMITVLTNRIKDVSEITEAIYSISEQTNLLALNASIEAARAGEAGKGFSVVADQIRVLSDDTRNSTSKISEIIEELTEASRNTMPLLDKSMDSIAEQIVNAGKISEHFMDTGKSMEVLSKALDEIQTDIAALYSSNTAIVDGINQLSENTEQTAAASEEGMRISDTIIESMGEFNTQISLVQEKLEELKTMV